MPANQLTVQSSFQGLLHQEFPNTFCCIQINTGNHPGFIWLWSRCWMALWRQVIIVRLQRCSLNWPSSQWWIIIVQDEKFNLGPTRSYESIKDCMLTAWYRSYSLLIIIRLPQFDNFLIFLNLIPLLNQFNYHWFHRDYRHCCQHLSQSAFAQERPRVFPRRRNASLLHRWEMD